MRSGVLFFSGIVLLYLLFIPRAFALLTITGVSRDDINSPDDEIVISASASGLQSTQYLEAAFTKQGEASNYFGLTLNQKEEWYSYKSSPNVSDLNSYFYTFTPAGGTWSGQIKAKLDLSDSGFKGAGIYTLKLVKYVTSSSYSVNTFDIKVNVTPVLTPSPSPSPTQTFSPTLTPFVSDIQAFVNPVTVTLSPVPTLKLFPTVYKIIHSTKAAILGTGSGSLQKTATPSAEVRTETLASYDNMFLSKIFVAIGIVFLVLCVILFVYPVVFTKFRNIKLNG